MTRGILAYGTYVPHSRLARDAITAGTGVPAGKGTRSVASYDEDTTSMAVEAGRRAIENFDRSRVETLVFTTPRPAYMEKTNATAVHAALGLEPDVAAYDAAGSLRSATGSIIQSLRGGPTTLIATADMRYGLPGAPDEREGGDAAAALIIGEGDDIVAACLATASVTDEFVHRWRLPAHDVPSVWEERFGEHVFRPLVERATQDVLKNAGLAPDEIDRVIVTGTHARAIRRAVTGMGLAPERVAEDFESAIGNTGAAHPGLVLAAELDTAPAGTTILLVVLSDGVDAMVLRTTRALEASRPVRSTRSQTDTVGKPVEYNTYLTWRGLLHREPPRRPEPVAPAAPPSHRHNAWKFGLVASRCAVCTRVHLPPREVCQGCGTVRVMEPQSMSGVRGRVATFTVDRLAYSLSPPVISAVVDFEGGGRLDCELTDVAPSDVRVGMDVEMTFRRLFTAGSLHNYFWKARPAGREDD